MRFSILLRACSSFSAHSGSTVTTSASSGVSPSEKLFVGIAARRGEQFRERSARYERTPCRSRYGLYCGSCRCGLRSRFSGCSACGLHRRDGRSALCRRMHCSAQYRRSRRSALRCRICRSALRGRVWCPALHRRIRHSALRRGIRRSARYRLSGCRSLRSVVLSGNFRCLRTRRLHRRSAYGKSGYLRYAGRCRRSCFRPYSALPRLSCSRLNCGRCRLSCRWCRLSGFRPNCGLHRCSRTRLGRTRRRLSCRGNRLRLNCRRALLRRGSCRSRRSRRRACGRTG